MHPIRLASSLPLGALLLGVAIHDAHAVGTRRFVLDSLKTLEGGDLTGVAIASDGTVRAGFSLANVAIPDATSVWAALPLKDGSVLLGTGAGGRIYRVRAGKVEIAAETGAMAVSALALGPGGDVVAGTFPDGRLYRSPPAKLTGQKLDPWITLEATEDVWALGYDAKRNALFAATGPEGKLYRVGGDGKAETYFDSDEAHLVSLALADDGTVYAGSNGKALLYKITGPGRASVLFDFDGDDVKAIALVPPHKGGGLYAIANSYEGALKGLRPKRDSGVSAAGPQPTKGGKAGKGELVRIDARGVVETMMKNDDAHYVSLALDATGAPYVGTGAEGRVYTVDDNHVERLVADTEERQVGALEVAGAQRFIVTTDPVVFHPITGSGGAEAVWTSKVLDAGLRAHFGLLEWRSEGQLELGTRSGNTDKPDASWSAWSKPLVGTAKIESPPARYLQVRARWSRDPNAVLQEVRVSFVTDNARALVTEITVGDSESSDGGRAVPESGGPPESHDAKLKLRWKVDNPDSDKLRYRLFYQPLAGAPGGARPWFAILDPREELTKTDYSWDTTGLPEGRYRVRVDATDELANPPDRVTRHSLVSRVVLVDNTPPQLTALALRGTKLSGTAVDGLGPIARIELSIVGSQSWLPVLPTDRVLDEASESFEVDIASALAPGAASQLVVVRVFDAAGNSVSRTVAPAAP
jgi:hypothetical protein